MENTVTRDATETLKLLRSAELESVAMFLLPGLALLEIGSGNGWQAREIRNKGCDVTAIDIDREGAWPEYYFEVQSYDGVNIPCDDSSQDIVFSSNVLEHVVDLQDLLVDTRRVLADNGVAVHILPTPAWRFWTTVAHYLHVARRLAGARETRARPTTSAGAVDANGWRKLVRRVILPGPHGESKTALHELWDFSSWRWKNEFRASGFEVVDHYTAGLFYTGHLLPIGLSMQGRRRLSHVLGSSCRVYVLKPKPK